MLTPSYSEIMDVLNREGDRESQVVTSRYSVVIAAAKRARQIVSGAPCDRTDVRTDKAVSIAISELGRGLIKVYPDGYEPKPGEWGGPPLEPEASEEDMYKDFYGDIDMNEDDPEDDELDEEDGFEQDGAVTPEAAVDEAAEAAE